MIFNITYDSSVNSAPAAFKTTINAVTQFFSAHFTDSITVDIQVGYGTIGGQALYPGDIGEGQVMRGDQPDGATLHQTAHQRLRADAAIVRVGPVQKLVYQE